MGQEDWRERIVVDPAIHHGDPCIRGTRVPVTAIVASIADADPVPEILAGYPSLTEEDVRPALRFAADGFVRHNGPDIRDRGDQGTYVPVRSFTGNDKVQRGFLWPRCGS